MLSNPPPTRPSPAARQRLNLAWLRRLRFAAAFGQGATVLVGAMLIPGELQIVALSVFVALGALSQLAADAVVRRWPDDRFVTDGASFMTALVVFDVVLLTALLAVSGGPSNPFTAFYIVHVVLSAVVLRPRSTWLISALAVIGYSTLFAWHVPVPSLEMSHTAHHAPAVEATHGDVVTDRPHDDAALATDRDAHSEGADEPDPHDPGTHDAGAHDASSHNAGTHDHGRGADARPIDPHRLHLLGMLAAFLMAAGFIVAFVTRLSTTLQRRDAELERARERAGRERQLAAMADLAAGAAHELATPLATIAIVAGEVEQTLDGADHVPAGVPEDLRLIRSELARCRRILDQMSVGAGQPVGEAPQRVALREVVGEALVNIDGADRVGIEVGDGGDTPVAVPVQAVARALRSLVTNALAAGDGPVVVRIEGDDRALRAHVVDEGVGMDDDTLAHLGEPFFTTRAPGRGMGLGVYLAHHLAEAIGGSLDYESTVGRGTTATLTIPVPT